MTDVKIVFGPTDSNGKGVKEMESKKEDMSKGEEKEPKKGEKCPTCGQKC